MLSRQVSGEVASVYVKPYARFQAHAIIGIAVGGPQVSRARIQVLLTFFGITKEMPCTNHPGLSAHMFILFLSS